MSRRYQNNNHYDENGGFYIKNLDNRPIGWYALPKKCNGGFIKINNNSVGVKEYHVV